MPELPDLPAATVQFFKYDGSLHWRHDVMRLGEDDFGVWLARLLGS